MSLIPSDFIPQKSHSKTSSLQCMSSALAGRDVVYLIMYSNFHSNASHLEQQRNRAGDRQQNAPAEVLRKSTILGKVF